MRSEPPLVSGAQSITVSEKTTAYNLKYWVKYYDIDVIKTLDSKDNKPERAGHFKTSLDTRQRRHATSTQHPTYFKHSQPVVNAGLFNWWALSRADSNASASGQAPKIGRPTTILPLPDQKCSRLEPKQAEHIHDDKGVSETGVSELRLLGEDHGASNNIPDLNYNS